MLADRSLLLEAVTQIGLDAEKAVAFLESGTGAAEVHECVEKNHRRGIHSIPVFLFSAGNFEATVHGSSDVGTFASMFRRIKEHAQKG